MKEQTKEERQAEQTGGEQIPTDKKERALYLVRTAEVVYAILSDCTRMPYVACDAETFDDEVFLFLDETAARNEALGLIHAGNPVRIAKVDRKNRLSFCVSLCPMGVNSLLVDKGTENEVLVQLSDLIKRPEGDTLPNGKKLVENQAFHLTALYFAQVFRKNNERQVSGELEELNEEMMAHFNKGKYIIAVQDKEILPILKQQDGHIYQPIFTDIQEFQKFNRENKFHPGVIEIGKLTGILSKDAVGVVVNPFGVNIKMDMKRKTQA